MKVKAICTECNIDKLNVNLDSGSFDAKETLPEGMCFLAFHQVFPYIRTLTTGGWFNWVGHNEHVIVKCPALNGIAVEVKAPAKNEPNVLECQVIEKRGPCFRGHDMDEQFRFDISEINLERLEILFDLFPNLMNSASAQKMEGSMNIQLREGQTRKVEYSVEFTKSSAGSL